MAQSLTEQEEKQKQTNKQAKTNKPKQKSEQRKKEQRFTSLHQKFRTTAICEKWELSHFLKELGCKFELLQLSVPK